jgi:hypothetical protein
MQPENLPQNTTPTPPPSPVGTTENINSQSRSLLTQRFIYIGVAVLVLLALLAVYFLINGRQPRFTQDNVAVTYADPAGEGDARLPEGFPRDIPVNPDRLIESIKMAYEDMGTTLYSVSFIAEASPAEEFAKYFSYIRNAGYNIEPESINAERGVLFGVRGGEEIQIIISPREEWSLVQIAYQLHISQ